MKQQLKISDVTDILKGKVSENRIKLEKLDAVEGMLPKDLIDEKKLGILDIIEALQGVQAEVLILMERESI